MSLPPRLIPLVHFLEDVLDRMGLKHAFGGALANNYWGVVRATQDVDLLVLLPALRAQEFADALNGAGFAQKGAGDAFHPVEVGPMLEEIREQKLFTAYRDGIKAEFFVPHIPLQDAILRRAVPLPFEGRLIPITTAEDLILLKMAFHRDKDLRDVRGILAVQKGRLDLAYLRAGAAKILERPAEAELVRWIRDYATGAGG